MPDQTLPFIEENVAPVVEDEKAVVIAIRLGPIL